MKHLDKQRETLNRLRKSMSMKKLSRRRIGNLFALPLWVSARLRNKETTS
jgi:hypothetical protein